MRILRIRIRNPVFVEASNAGILTWAVPRTEVKFIVPLLVLRFKITEHFIRRSTGQSGE
jgi:hypothetical protein